MTHVLPSTTQVTPAWLTAVLKRHLLLGEGDVRAIEQQSNQAFNSHLWHLHATFSEGVPPGVPNRFVLKQNLKAPWAIKSGAQEATFYQTVAELPDHPPVIVPCYDAVVDATTGDSHILLLDLSESHIVPLTREQQLDAGNNLPSDIHLAQAVDALARFHAFWWQHPRWVRALHRSEHGAVMKNILLTRWSGGDRPGTICVHMRPTGSRHG